MQNITPLPPLDKSRIPQARQYGDVAAVYDTLMDNVPHALWLSRMERAARGRGKSPRSVLDIACGTGIATFLLAERGYGPVVGVDISAPMIAIARTKALAGNYRGAVPTFAVQDVSALNLPDPPFTPFDWVVSMFDSLNYILEPERLRAAFAHIHAHTARGGIFTFDLNSLYALANHFFTQTEENGPVRHVWRSFWERETRLCRVEMAFEVDEVNADGTTTTRTFHETHLQRAYTVPEITGWLTDAGFRQIDVYGNYGDQSPNSKSDRLLFVAERPEK